MLDAIGNKLTEGSLVYWCDKKMIFLVANVNDGSGKSDPPHVTLQNPASALLLDGILGEGKKGARKQ